MEVFPFPLRLCGSRLSLMVVSVHVDLRIMGACWDDDVSLDLFFGEVRSGSSLRKIFAV
jgi:hypothetical protein